MKTKKNFPNGFESWTDTHFEMVQAITIEHTKKEPKGIVSDRHKAGGHCELYSLAVELTNEFEEKFKDKIWDGEFFDEVEKFIKEKFFN